MLDTRAPSNKLPYNTVKRKLFNYKLSHILAPVINTGETFVFPMNSVVYRPYISDIPSPVTKDLGYLINTTKVIVKPILTYTEPITGKVMRSSLTTMSVFNTAKKAEPSFKYIKPQMTLMRLRPTDLLVYDAGNLNSMYRYSANPMSDYNKWDNNLRTVIDTINKDADERVKFMVLNIPSKLLPRITLDKYSKKLTSIAVKKIIDINQFSVIDLWRLFTPELKNESLLSKISNPSKVNLVLRNNDNLSVINLGLLMSLSDDYKLEDGFKSLKDSVARKLLYIFLYRIVNIVTNNTNNQVTATTLTEREEADDTDMNTIDIDQVITDDVIEEEEVEEDDESVDESDEEVEVAYTTDDIDSVVNSEYVTYNDLDEVKVDTEPSTAKVLSKLEILSNNNMLTKASVEKTTNTLKEVMKLPSPFAKGKTLGDVINDTTVSTLNPEDTSITDTNVIFDKRLNNDIITKYDKEYLSKHHHSNIIKNIFAIQNAGVVIEDYNINVTDSVLGGTEEHVIKVKPLNGNSSTIKLLLPTISEDGTFKVSKNTYRLRKQRADLPIRKISQTEVSLSSYYGKLFVSKATSKFDDLGYWFKNQLVNLSNDNKVRDLILSSVDNKDNILPKSYSLLSRYTRSFTYGKYKIHLEYATRIGKQDADVISKIETSKKVVFLGTYGTELLFMGTDDIVSRLVDNSLVAIGTLLNILGLELDKTPMEFASMRIYKKQLPVCLLLTYYLGLDNLLKLLKVKYTKLDPNARSLSSNDQYVVAFENSKYVITKDNELGDMILGGFKAISKTLKTINTSILNSKANMGILFNKLDLPLLYVNEIKLLEDMFIDPITKSLLTQLKQPTSFKGLLIEAAVLLTDDNYVHPNNINEMVIRGYERVSGMMYSELVKSIKEHNNRSFFSKSKISIKPYAIVNKIGEDSATVIVDDLNPIAAMKQAEDTTYLGANGRSKDGMNRDTRIMHKSEIGVISEATKDSGDVGISTYMSANPKLDNTSGTVGKFSFAKDGWGSVLSTSALLAPFSTTDDVKRVNFINVQSSHVIPMNEMRAPYVRTGYESIVAVRSNDKYVMSALEQGEVIKVTKSEIVVTYKTLGTKKYPIKSWTTKEESGACYTHRLVTDFKPGDKFRKDDSLTYDVFFFEKDIFDNRRVIYKQGTTVNVVLTEEMDTYEDSTSISGKLAHRLGTVVTKVKSIVINNTDNISNLVLIGDKVEPTSPLFTITDNLANQDLDERTLAILQHMKANTPKASIRGKINKIEVYYNCEPEDTTPSVKALIANSDTQLKKDTGYTGRVTNSYSIGGKPLMENEVEIKLYIDAADEMGVGDKFIYGNQLKCTVGNVYSNDIITEDGTVVEAMFSNLSIGARIVNSPLLIGTTSMLLDKLKDKVVSEYFN